MVFGINSISWGIQFSYPQLYQDENCQIQVVKPGPEFPNTVLFQKMQRWIRQHTIPTPFLTPYQRINAPIRMGRQVLNWINNHPQLKAKNLSIKTS
jgi:hypothetical protein